jgi:hypothetical protein
MKVKSILVLLLVAALAGCTDTEQPRGCTMEAKLCPDGSAVGRVGPNCEFAPCPNATNCSAYGYYECPSECVVCPPCYVCSSISCRSEEFCASIGFNRSWYDSVKPRCECPEGYVQEGYACYPKCYYSTPQCLAPSIPCNSTQN